MGKKLALKSFRLKNFKAIRDSGVVKFTPLTVLIGDNGSGKSSLIEGLRTYQQIASNRLMEIMYEWGGFDNVCNPPASIGHGSNSSRNRSRSISFSLRGTHSLGSWHTSLTVRSDTDTGYTYIDKETMNLRNRRFARRNRNGEIIETTKDKGLEDIVHKSPSSIPAHTPYFGSWLLQMQPERMSYRPGKKAESLEALNEIDWHFFELDPNQIGKVHAIPVRKDKVYLESDGSNLTEYLLDIRIRNKEAYDGIVETMKYVLPFVENFEPAIVTYHERVMVLQLYESDFVVPGWLMSTGTVRLLALLALFRHPEPPPVIIIEEIENGLDPRAIHLIVEEIRNVVESGRSQIIVTTHSPYLLDLLPLWSIVLVEREENKGPVFFRPDEQPELDSWLERFGPGKLYTMQGLRLGASQ